MSPAVLKHNQHDGGRHLLTMIACLRVLAGEKEQGDCKAEKLQRAMEVWWSQELQIWLR